MIPTSPLNYIFVKMKAYDDEIKTKSGVTLYKDTTYNPEWNATISAEALSIPLSVRQYRPEEKGGLVSMETKGLTEFVKKGDIVLFRYMVVMQREQNDGYEDNHLNKHLIDGEIYWKVDYNMVLGVIRDGKLIPANGYIFAKKPEEKKVESFLIIPDHLKTESVKNCAVVEYVGEPKKGAKKLDIVKGDKILFNDQFAEKYTINDEDFLVIRQEYVMGKQ